RSIPSLPVRTGPKVAPRSPPNGRPPIVAASDGRSSAAGAIKALKRGVASRTTDEIGVVGDCEPANGTAAVASVTPLAGPTIRHWPCAKPLAWFFADAAINDDGRGLRDELC